jgi:hypothetical protein
MTLVSLRYKIVILFLETKSAHAPTEDSANSAGTSLSIAKSRLLFFNFHLEELLVTGTLHFKHCIVEYAKRSPYCRQR